MYLMIVWPKLVTLESKTQIVRFEETQEKNTVLHCKNIFLLAVDLIC